MGSKQIIKDLNNRPLQVYNSIRFNDEGEPTGLTHNESSPSSMNYGDEREPRKGSCYEPDGTNFVNIPRITGDISEMTISFWAFFREDSNDLLYSQSYILSNEMAVTEGNYSLSYLSQGLRFRSWVTGPTLDIGNIPVGVWSHLVMTFKVGEDIAWWVNGVKRVSMSANDPIPGSLNDVHIGGKPSDEIGRLTGTQLMDFVYVDRAFTDQEIDELYSLRKLPNLSGYQGAFYKMDETSKAKAVDCSGNVRDGIISGLNVDFHSNQNFYSWHNNVGFTSDFEGLPLNPVAPEGYAVKRDKNKLTYTSQIPYQHLTNVQLGAVQSGQTIKLRIRHGSS